MSHEQQVSAEGKLQHLLSLEGLPRAVIVGLLDQAQSIIDQGLHRAAILNDLHDKTIANLFFEASTRTRVSFELAAKRLGALLINFDSGSSATQKGETLLDTVVTLQAMGVNAFVVRHSKNGTAEFLAQHVKPGVSILNAGDGTRAHPSQALLDMLTIRQHKTDFDQLTVAIVGDVLHSRVARSQLVALQTLGVPAIRLVAPAGLLPPANEVSTVEQYTDLTRGIQDADVVIMLRIQKERMMAGEIPTLEKYHASFGLTAETLKHAKPDAIVMHPGPMNRGIEIDSCVADGPQSVISQQVTNGIAMRMAIMQQLLG